MTKWQSIALALALAFAAAGIARHAYGPPDEQEATKGPPPLELTDEPLTVSQIIQAQAAKKKVMPSGYKPMSLDEIP